MKKHIRAILLAAGLCLSLAACDRLFAPPSGADAGPDPEVSDLPSPAVDPDPGADQDAAEAMGRDDGGTWAIYWYLCGSDLESLYGFATDDLLEMLEVSLPRRVRVVIQTGGAAEWQNDMVDADHIDRYTYENKELRLVERLPQANMGDPDTLADFLSFCTRNYPADRTMVLFWDHGGGSVTGAVFDENYRNDSLTLDELHEAFDEVYELDTGDPPIDVIGFDACLMATVDVAYTFRDAAHYLVASEEWEPGEGWYYSGWLRELSANPAMDGAQLGRIICDTYVKGCRLAGVQDEITLSVTDLTRIGPLLAAYDAMGQEALAAALEDPAFLSAFGREAGRSENYGGNTDEQGYTNLVDLGHLAQNSRKLLPETAQAVLDGLDRCVIYRVNGPYRSEATGLSCYYSYSGDRGDLADYAGVGCSEAFQYLYDFELDGELSREGMEYVTALGYLDGDLPEMTTLETDEDYPVYVDDNGYAVLDVGPEVAALLRGVYFQLAYVDEEADLALLLGRDNNLYADWENGVFMDDFWGEWGSIDGHLVYMELVYEGDYYNTYTVPILLNGEEYNLRVVYSFVDGLYHILGARRELDNTGMADKNLVHLQPGDEVTTILYAATISGDDDFAPLEVETFTVTEDTSFYETELGDGEFMMLFELVDIRNETAWSEAVWFSIEDGEIYTIVYE